MNPNYVDAGWATLVNCGVTQKGTIMTLPEGKHMATAVAAIDEELASAIRAELERIPEVLSVAYRLDDGVMSLWIGVPECEHSVRKSIYAVEDWLAERFPIAFEFHLVTLEQGQDLRRYVSTAAPIYRRAA